MAQPIVTIFVTVYQIEKYLDRFFACIFEQSVPDFEVLIIEDGSTDKSLSVCRKYASQDDRIRIIPVKHIGISAARNLAFENIRTEYATSLDGDDIFDKDYLKHLIDAQKKYNADFVISNVVYLNEDLTERKRFVERKEGFFTKDRFSDILPELVEEERLNYLYGKLYKTQLLKDIRVEPDVKMGSDTMINIQYCMKIDSIAVIENYDYSNIKYISRSVTSYNGNDYFHRLYRINRFVYDITLKNGYLNEKMLRVIDGRIIYSGFVAVQKLCWQKRSTEEKCASASQIIESEEYLQSYERQKDHLDSYSFKVLVPGQEKEYVRFRCSVIAEEKRNLRQNKLRRMCPDFLFHIYHKAKIRMGIIPPDKEK